MIYSVNGQDEKGNVILKVYSNFHKGITEDDLSTAFEIKRVYLGYEKSFSEYFYAEVKLDIGSPEDLSQYSLIRRYAYFKTAGLKYRRGRLTIHAGLFGMLQFKLQEDFWGYRYIAKSFQDEYKFGPSADIGAGVSYRISPSMSADLVVSNGEGYNNLQTDNKYKTSAGITLKSLNNVTARIYYDLIAHEIIQHTIASFIGYHHDYYRIGAEYNLRLNEKYLENHDRYGFSFYGSYMLNESWELFGRYDRLNSNVLTEENMPWNIDDDGSAIIAGIQYTPVNGVKLSLNYQDWYAYAQNGPEKNFIYLNLEFKI